MNINNLNFITWLFVKSTIVVGFSILFLLIFFPPLNWRTKSSLNFLGIKESELLELFKIVSSFSDSSELNSSLDFPFDELFKGIISFEIPCLLSFEISCLFSSFDINWVLFGVKNDSKIEMGIKI